MIELVRKKRSPKDYPLKENQNQVTVLHDTLRLSGVLTNSTTDTTKATIILIHGVRGRKESWQAKSQELADSSYQTLAIDLRAHGDSAGKFTTFGVKEKVDVQAWVDWLHDQPEFTNTPLGIWGRSLGGSVALHSLAVEKRLQFGIIESTYHDFEVIAGDYSKDYIGVNIKPLTSNLLKRAAKRADFHLEDAKTSNAAALVTQPILFSHGSEDEKIKIDYNVHNFDAVPHKKKAFYTVEGAGHYNLWEVGGEAYFNKVLDFIDANTIQVDETMQEMTAD